MRQIKLAFSPKRVPGRALERRKLNISIIDWNEQTERVKENERTRSFVGTWPGGGGGELERRARGRHNLIGAHLRVRASTGPFPDEAIEVLEKNAGEPRHDGTFLAWRGEEYSITMALLDSAKRIDMDNTC